MRRTWFLCVVFVWLGLAAWCSAPSLARPAGLLAGSAPVRAGRLLVAGRVGGGGCAAGVVAPSAVRLGADWMLVGRRRVEPRVGRDVGGVAQAFLVRAGASGEVSSIHVYVGSGGRARVLMVALYSNSGCRPGSVLTAGSVDLRVVGGRGGKVRGRGAWRAVGVSGVGVVAGRMYWLVVLARGGVFRFREGGSGGCVSQSSRRGHLTSLPRLWKVVGAGHSCAISAFAAGRRGVFLVQHPPGQPAPGQPAPGQPGTSTPALPLVANLWVSQAGGSCSRQAVAGLEIPSQDCGSLDAAYKAAQCGDVVNISPGTYPQQSLVDDSAHDTCSSAIVFDGSPSGPRSSVVLAGVDGGSDDHSASNWTLQNATVTAGLSLWAPGHDITINDDQTGDFYMGGPWNVTVENSNLGPCYNAISLPAGQSNETGQPGPTYSPNPAVRCNSNIKLDSDGSLANITFKNNVIHDFLDDDSNTYYDHFECMFIDGGTNITVDSNEFYDCQIYAIFIQPFEGYPLNGLTIQNNWFWADQGIMGACASEGNCPAENAGGVHADTVVFGDETSTDVSNVLIRYNSFDPCCGIANEATAPASSQNVRVVGNILGNTATNCISGLTYSYNLWETADHGALHTCGTGDATTAAAPFVATGGFGPALEDLHLRCGSPAQNFVTPTTSDYQLNYDINGNPRNSNGPRDAGASAETSCGT